jgi:hypothetical protein
MVAKGVLYLSVWADVFFPVDVFRVTPSPITLLCATHLTAPHRRSHEQDHKHDRNRDHDHHDAGANREHKKGGAHHASSFPGPFLTPQDTRYGGRS